jgi:hypothetical protein
MTAGGLDENYVCAEVGEHAARHRRRLTGEVDDAGAGQECFAHRSSSPMRRRPML